MAAVSLKAGKLEKGLQEFQSFLMDKIEHNPKLQSVHQELEKISSDLKMGKLSLQIIGQDSNTSQTIGASLETHKSLEVYQITTASLPVQSRQKQFVSRATLTYEEPAANATDITKSIYELPANQKIRVGRNPQCEIFLQTGLYPYTSWNHLEIEPSNDADPDSVCPTWIIRDLNSSNGTYINDSHEKLQGDRILQSGDRITLLPPTLDESKIEFMFECNSNAAVADAPINQRLVDCDILCIVVESNQWLLENAMHLVKHSHSSQTARLVVLAGSQAEPAQAEELSAEVEMEIKKQFPSLDLAIFSLDSNSSSSDVRSTEAQPKTQFKLAELIVFLEGLAKRKPEDVLLKRLTAKVHFQLALVEQIYTAREEVISQEIQQQEKNLQDLGQNELAVKKAFKEISDTKDFFKRVKGHISSSESALLNKLSPKSVLYKHQSFLDELQIVEFRQKGFKYIRLEAGNVLRTTSLHSRIIALLQFELGQWAIEEQEKIYTFYEGGLNRILEKTCDTIDRFVPSFTSSDLLAPMNQSDEMLAIFQEPIAEIPSEIRCPEFSLGNYILKNLRSNYMTLGITISMTAAIGLPLGGRQALQQGIDALTKFISSTFGLSNSLPHFIALCLLLIPVSLLIICGYIHEKNSKLEEVAAKLRKELSNHYQAVAEHFIEGIVQALNVLLELEEQRLRLFVEAANEQLINCPAGRRTNSTSSKETSLDTLKHHQKMLQSEKAALQKLKRSF